MPDNKIYFHYGKNTKTEKQKKLYNSVIDLKNCVKKNREFFSGINIWLLTDFTSVEHNSTFAKSVELMDNTENSGGITSNPIFNNGKKEIFIKDSQSIFNDNKKTINDIKGYIIHELGHQFNWYFASPPKELVDCMQNLTEEEILNTPDPNNPKYLKFKQYLQVNGLSDSKEFIEAWKKDVEALGKSRYMIGLIQKLGYFSPYHFVNFDNNNKNDIDITDGLSQKEINETDRERQEEFAQLFCYALGGELSGYDKKIITETYANTYKVVKNYIKQFWGIE
ncbi:MAG: hypothetical protein MJ237_08840 [bacterium]|nr:hypothetical protein [bacterium]